MLGVETVNQPVEEPPPGGGAIGEQTAHVGRKPDDGDEFGQLCLAARGFAAHLDHALAVARFTVG